jgi:hypothetical protein
MLYLRYCRLVKQFKAKTGREISMVEVSTHEPWFIKIFGKYYLETSTKR